MPAPILVTGMHRSGTTWVGRMLCASERLTYVSEPLNPVHPAILRLPVSSDYTYISDANEAEFLPIFRDALKLRSRPIAELAAVAKPGDAARLALTSVQMLRGRIAGRRPLFKDPYALFSAEWFAERLGCRVVVCVRHPAAVVSSLVRLNWRAPLAALSSQPDLRRDLLEGAESDLSAAERDPSLRRDLVWGNAVLWRIIHQTVSSYRARRPDFTIVRHEDLSRDPEGEFARLYARLDLPLDKRALGRIAAASSQANPGELSVDDPHAIRLDSRRNVTNWQRRLTPADVGRIREIVEPVAAEWYDESDWR